MSYEWQDDSMGMWESVTADTKPVSKKPVPSPTQWGASCYSCLSRAEFHTVESEDRNYKIRICNECYWYINKLHKVG